MLIGTYGTLKRGHHNNVILMHADFLEERVIKGFKLLDSGFPVAVPCEKSSIKIEIFDIHDDQACLQRLDRLESEGRMYIRTKVDDFEMYVGNPPYWGNFERLEEIQQIDGVYEYHPYRRTH